MKSSNIKKQPIPRSIDYETWLEEFRPIKNEDETIKDYYNGSKESDVAIRKAINEQKLWSLVVGDDSYQMYIYPSLKVVNVSEIYITEIPWGDIHIRVNYYTKEEMEDNLISSISNMLKVNFNKVYDHILKTANYKKEGKKTIPPVDSLIEYEYAVDHIMEVLRETDPKYKNNDPALAEKILSLGFEEAIKRVNLELK